MFPVRVPGHLKKWRLVHNRSRSVQTFRSFNQLISNHLKDFILIQTINFLPSRLCYRILARSRSPERRHKIRLRAVSYFSLDTVECEHARGASGESARNEGWLVYFSHCIGVLVLVFLLSSVLFHYSDGVTGPFFVITDNTPDGWNKQLNISLRKMSCGKRWKWHFRYPKVKNFRGEHAPRTPRLGHLRRYNFSSQRTHTLQISRYVDPEQFL